MGSSVDQNTPGSEMLQAAGWGAEGAHWAAVGQGYANEYSQMGQAYANQYSRISNMRISTLVLVGLTQTSTDASHREPNRSFFVNMPPTASMRAVHLEAHSERRFCVQVTEYLL